MIRLAVREHETCWLGEKHPHERRKYRGLSRYHDINYSHFLASCESGWDHSTRCDGDRPGTESGRWMDHLPVCLNSILCMREVDFAWALGQLGAVSPKFGEGKECAAIAAAVLGGTSLFGGRGSVLPGTLLGALLIQTIENGLVVVNANPYLYPMVTSAVIFAAVLLESLRNRAGPGGRLPAPSSSKS